MKNKMMNGLLALVAIPMIFALSACGKNDGGGAVAVAPVSYYTANGQCYQANTTTVVSTTLCQNSGYYQSNGQCYQTGTNTPVAISLCNQTSLYPTTGIGTYPVTQVPVGYYPGIGGNLGGMVGGYGGVCQGWFFQPGYGWGVCNGYNCHAMVLYNAQGQPVYCP